VGHTGDGTAVTAADLGAPGAMAALLRDALKPNLVQTGEGTPVLLHAGPFANIAHGNSSVLADRLALRLADYVVTEAGFGADMGAEKFFNIKCRAAGYAPALAVLVASVRALKFHALGRPVKAGGALPADLERPDPGLVERGAANLARQIGVVRTHGIPVVVALNRMPTDSVDELRAAAAAARGAGALDAVVSEGFARGGAGTAALADAVVAHADAGTARFRPLYPDDAPLPDKIAAICTRVYGAEGVDFDPAAAATLAALADTPLARMPVCMAKTQYSLSADPTRLGAPTGFRVPVRDVRPAPGAGFVVARCGDIATMPGLPARPRGLEIDVDDAEAIVGI
jgi:formate--tetrahydrofolate ligase